MSLRCFLTLFIVVLFLKAIFLKPGPTHYAYYSTNLWLSLHKTAMCIGDVLSLLKCFENKRRCRVKSYSPYSSSAWWALYLIIAHTCLMMMKHYILYGIDIGVDWVKKKSSQANSTDSFLRCPQVALKFSHARITEWDDSTTVLTTTQHYLPRICPFVIYFPRTFKNHIQTYEFSSWHFMSWKYNWSGFNVSFWVKSNQVNSLKFELNPALVV